MRGIVDDYAEIGSQTGFLVNNQWAHPEDGYMNVFHDFPWGNWVYVYKLIIYIYYYLDGKLHLEWEDKYFSEKEDSKKREGIVDKVRIY